MKMRFIRNCLFALCLVVITALITSCDFFSNLINENKYNDFYVESSTLTVNNIKIGEDVYLVSVNPSIGVLSNLRYVENTTGIVKNAPSINRSISTDSEYILPENIDVSSDKYIHFTPKNDLPPLVLSANRAASVTSQNNLSSKSTNASQLSVGYSKDLFIDGSIDVSSGKVNYQKKKATIRYASNNCYVWVVDEYYLSSKTGDEKGKVSDAKAKEIGENFDKLSPKVRNVFGNESNLIISSGSLANMETNSATGTKINIVLYDVAGDKSGDGVVGYFSSKDYYKDEKITQGFTSQNTYSNVGKYFYIDSYATNLEDTSSLYSTIVHEFEHMISFNTKYLSLDRKQSETWYSEMLSMLCEDIMQTQISDKIILPELKTRLLYFNAFYPNVGVEYRTDNDVYASFSYSAIYAFASYLARSYGGVNFVKTLATNRFINEESILDAVKQHTKKDVTMKDLFIGFSDACIDNESGYKLNKTVTETINSTSYKLPNIDLFSNDYAWPMSWMSKYSASITNSKTSDNKYLGPAIFSSNMRFNSMRPYSILLFYLGKTSSSTVTINLSAGSGTQTFGVVQK